MDVSPQDDGATALDDERVRVAASDEPPRVTEQAAGVVAEEAAEPAVEVAGDEALDMLTAPQEDSETVEPVEATAQGDDGGLVCSASDESVPMLPETGGKQDACARDNQPDQESTPEDVGDGAVDVANAVAAAIFDASSPGADRALPDASREMPAAAEEEEPAGESVQDKPAVESSSEAPASEDPASGSSVDEAGTEGGEEAGEAPVDSVEGMPDSVGGSGCASEDATAVVDGSAAVVDEVGAVNAASIVESSAPATTEEEVRLYLDVA